MAALYSGEVHSLLVLDTEFADVMLEALGPSRPDEPFPIRRMRSYLGFIARERSELELATSQSILKPLLRGDLEDVLKFRSIGLTALGEMLERLRSDGASDETLLDPFAALGALSGATYADLTWITLGMNALNGEDTGIAFKDPALANMLMQGAYLLMLAAVAESRGIALSTWDNDWLRALWRFRSEFTTDPLAESRGRRAALQKELGTAILERQVPCVADLPLEAILEIRAKRSAEVEGFRVGIAALVAEIDISQPLDASHLEIDALISRTVDPALHQLRIAVTDSRSRLLLKLGDSTQSLAAATVPAVLAFSAGAPLEMTAAVGALGALVGAVADGVLERRSLVRGSQWGLVYRLARK